MLAGYSVIHVRVTLVDGKADSVDSSGMAFYTPAALATGTFIRFFARYDYLPAALAREITRLPQVRK